jgi:hypothetical protein
VASRHAADRHEANPEIDQSHRSILGSTLKLSGLHRLDQAPNINDEDCGVWPLAVAHCGEST